LGGLDGELEGDELGGGEFGGGEFGGGEFGGSEFGGGELDDDFGDLGDFGDRFHQDDGLADVLINFFAEEPF
jgi:hypothetical protein